jgi:hypothetical protein
VGTTSAAIPTANPISKRTRMTVLIDRLGVGARNLAQ